MKVDAVIFDWSGVISNDINYAFAIVNGVREKYYKLPPISTDEYKANITLDFPSFWKNTGVNDDIDSIQKKFDSFIGKVSPGPSMIEGAYEAICSLKLKNKKLAVFSAHTNVLEEMKGYGIESFFDKVMFPVRKRSLDDYCSALKEMIGYLEVKKSRVVLVEDMSEGIRAGKASGIKTIAIAHPEYGYHSVNVLMKERPSALITDIKDLEKIIE